MHARGFKEQRNLPAADSHFALTHLCNYFLPGLLPTPLPCYTLSLLLLILSHSVLLPLLHAVVTAVDTVPLLPSSLVTRCRYCCCYCPIPSFFPCYTLSLLLLLLSHSFLLPLLHAVVTAVVTVPFLPSSLVTRCRYCCCYCPIPSFFPCYTLSLLLLLLSHSFLLPLLHAVVTAVDTVPFLPSSLVIRFRYCCWYCPIPSSLLHAVVTAVGTVPFLLPCYTLSLLLLILSHSFLLPLLHAVVTAVGTVPFLLPCYTLSLLLLVLSHSFFPVTRCRYCCCYCPIPSFFPCYTLSLLLLVLSHSFFLVTRCRYCCWYCPIPSFFPCYTLLLLMLLILSHSFLLPLLHAVITAVGTVPFLLPCYTLSLLLLILSHSFLLPLLHAVVIDAVDTVPFLPSSLVTRFRYCCWYCPISSFLVTRCRYWCCWYCPIPSTFVTCCRYCCWYCPIPSFFPSYTLSLLLLILSHSFLLP